MPPSTARAGSRDPSVPADNGEIFCLIVKESILPTCSMTSNSIDNPDTFWNWPLVVLDRADAASADEASARTTPSWLLPSTRGNETSVTNANLPDANPLISNSKCEGNQVALMFAPR